MATVAKALEAVTLADLLGIQRAALAMGATNFAVLAGGTMADFVAIMNSLTAVKAPSQTASDTTADTQIKSPVQAIKQHAPMGSLLRFHIAVTDADETEFNALTGDTQANVLAWLNDVIGIIRWNSDTPNSNAAWSEAL